MLIKTEKLNHCIESLRKTFDSATRTLENEQDALSVFPNRMTTSSRASRKSSINVSLPNSLLKNKANIIKSLTGLTNELLSSFQSDTGFVSVSPNQTIATTTTTSVTIAESGMGQSQNRKRSLRDNDEADDGYADDGYSMNLNETALNTRPNKTKQLRMDQINYDIKLEIKICSDPQSDQFSVKQYEECVEDMDDDDDDDGGDSAEAPHATSILNETSFFQCPQPPLNAAMPVEASMPNMSICMTDPANVFTSSSDDDPGDYTVIDTPVKENIFDFEEDFVKKAILKSSSRLECLNTTTANTSRTFNNTTLTLNNTTIVNDEPHGTAQMRHLKAAKFVCSLLKPEIKDLVKEFIGELGADVCDDITDDTTHLIVQSDDDLLCGVTTKYLKAIAKKMWIVSVQWVLKCLDETVVSIEDFEIKGDSVFGVHLGPNRSRTSKARLFEAYQFLFVGKFTSTFISLGELTGLAQSVGACIVEKAKNFHEGKIRVAIFDEKQKGFTEESANFMLESAKIYSVNASWFFDSLACYEIKDMSHYALYTISCAKN